VFGGEWGNGIAFFPAPKYFSVEHAARDVSADLYTSLIEEFILPLKRDLQTQ